jgi:hypothetical protein
MVLGHPRSRALAPARDDQHDGQYCDANDPGCTADKEGQTRVPHCSAAGLHRLRVRYVVRGRGYGTWRHRRDQRIPVDVTAGRSGARTGKGIAKDVQVRDPLQHAPSPSYGPPRTALATDLVEEESSHSIDDAVIVRLRDPPQSVQGEAQEPPFGYGGTKKPMGTRHRWMHRTSPAKSTPSGASFTRTRRRRPVRSATHARGIHGNAGTPAGTFTSETSSSRLIRSRSSSMMPSKMRFPVVPFRRLQLGKISIRVFRPGLGRPALDDDIEGSLLVFVLPFVNGTDNAGSKCTTVAPRAAAENDEEEEENACSAVNQGEKQSWIQLNLQTSGLGGSHAPGSGARTVSPGLRGPRRLTPLRRHLPS